MKMVMMAAVFSPYLKQWSESEIAKWRRKYEEENAKGRSRLIRIIFKVWKNFQYYYILWLLWSLLWLFNGWICKCLRGLGVYFIKHQRFVHAHQDLESCWCDAQQQQYITNDALMKMMLIRNYSLKISAKTWQVQSFENMNKTWQERLLKTWAVSSEIYVEQ